MGTTTLVLQYKPGPGRRSVPLARIRDPKMAAQAARLAVAEAKKAARSKASDDRVIAYRDALKAAALDELLTAVTVNA
ncbi:MAG: hypothetical protein ACE141_14390 [Bryobacteraceae bacterium]